MHLYEVAMWGWIISWTIALIIIGFIGISQIRYGLLRDSTVQFNPRDKQNRKLAAIIFIVGVFLLVIALISKCSPRRVD